MTAQLKRGDPSLGLPNQIESQEPDGQRQLGGFHDRAGRERDLMATGSALVALEPPPVDQAMLMPTTARASEAIRPPRFLQGCLTLCLIAIEGLELPQRKALLKLDSAAPHGMTSICVPLKRLGSPAAERAA